MPSSSPPRNHPLDQNVRNSLQNRPATAASTATSPSDQGAQSPQQSATDSIVHPKKQRLQSRPPREQSPGPLALSSAFVASIGSATASVIASSTLPYRRSNPSLSTVFASTASHAGSASGSGAATPTPNSARPGASRNNSITPSGPAGSGAAAIAGSTAAPSSPAAANGRTASPARTAVAGAPNARVDLEPRNLILRSYVPHIAVVASEDTDELLRSQKGLSGGLLELLRPYGEKIMGRVTIRDSIGAGRSWDDYGVRFTGLKDGLRPPRASLDRQSQQQQQQQGTGRQSTDSRSSGRNGVGAGQPASLHCDRTGGDVEQIEEAVAKHLEYGEYQSDDATPDYFKRIEALRKINNPQPTSPFHLLYLRRLLSGIPMLPHETFSHPVACVIAISSTNPTPIEELRRLYTSTFSGDHKLPQWVDRDYLRYYVLVHDEDNGDIQRSTSLFDSMKRHFGLHCHLLRLRSNQAVPSDDDSVRLPMCEWISASEELEEIRKRENLLGDFDEDPTPCIFESDVTAVRTFIREMVTQSVVPFMERTATTWNEQVASRKRGLSGRFMSLSKRWTPFGSSRGSSGVGGGGGGSGGGSGNYDSLQGFYRPDAPEATLRKLADYAFMLRDFKLAHSTYELARSDFQTDKAWRHYAGANEMAALSALLLSGGVFGAGNGAPSVGSSSGSSSSSIAKARPEAVEQLLETALYSFVTRCAAPYYALRTLALATELLRLRGSADDAARWARRALEARLVGPVGTALFTERVGACYAGRPGVGSLRWGSRKRKSALFAVLAAEEWMRLGKTARAQECLAEARIMYGIDAGVAVEQQPVKDGKGGDDDEKTAAAAAAAPTLAPTTTAADATNTGPAFAKDREAACTSFDRPDPPFVEYLAFLGERIEAARRAARGFDVAVDDSDLLLMPEGTTRIEDSQGGVLHVDEVDEVVGEALQDRRRHRKSLIGGIDPSALTTQTRGLGEQTDGSIGKGFE